MFRFVLIFVLLIGSSGLEGAAQEGISGFEDRRTMTAVRIPDGVSIDLDGRLDEAAWELASPATDFVQIEPDNGSPATERTEVYIIYTDSTLYMGVIAYDSEPTQLKGNTMARDAFLSADDRFMWIFDTYLDERTGYFFEINPSGAMGDSLVGGGGGNGGGGGGNSARAWDGIWTARVRQSEIGWVAEIEMPVRTLNFDPSGQAWGINFQRTVRRKNEEMIWNGFARNATLRQMSNAGLVTGLERLNQGVGLDISPYAVGSTLYDSRVTDPNNRTSYTGDAGVDFVYSVTPSLRANFTINTDFAETEVDTRQVNLTRFPLRFPEKREFFLEGNNFFTMADFGDTFFSRRIGLNEGLPQRIEYGAKLTGQVGAQDIGALQVRTADENGLLGEDFTVLRGKRRFWSESFVGMLYTRRAARESDNSNPSIPAPPDLHTIGFDFNANTRTFLGDKNLSFQSSYIHTTNPAATGKGDRYGIKLDYNNDLITWGFHFSETQANFDPAVGFVTRRGVKDIRSGFLFSPRPLDHPLIRQYSFLIMLVQATDSKNQLLSRTLNLNVFQLNFHSGDNFSIQIVPSYERLERNFRQADRKTGLPAGEEYSFTRYNFSWGMSGQRPLALGGRISLGSYFNGTRRDIGPNLSLRPQNGLIINLSAQFSRIELEEGSFSTSLLQADFNKQFSPWIQASSNIQYDTVSRILGWQARFRWILRPGNDIFFVYTQNWLSDPNGVNGLETIDRKAASKLVYTHRF